MSAKHGTHIVADRLTSIPLPLAQSPQRLLATAA